MRQFDWKAFHPLIRSWFLRDIGNPTDVQSNAWPKIADGQNILVSAPTGSGKTLTAFLWSLNQLITGVWQTGSTRVLYISPLKALNNDVRRNLLHPLDSLKTAFQEAGEPFPEIRVLTRSGDTSQTDRRQLIRRPPEILITTPESFNLLLGSKSGRSILTRIETVILDEIHAVISTKRGTYLITALERLVPLSGEFQRIALSATVKPMETVSGFIGGFKLSGSPQAPFYTQRPVSSVYSNIKKTYRIQVRTAEESSGPEFKDDFWKPMIQEFKSIIERHQSTLFFTNSRKMAESITLKINAGEEKPLAYAHHGSLSREIRLNVEQKLKAGELRAIVATSSLELGIDIGELDRVVLIQSPGSISSAIQRFGRAGHTVGEVSQGYIYPTHDMDFLEAAVLGPDIVNQNIEQVKPIKNALDVLAQILIAMVGIQSWDTDQLYNQIRTSWPYKELSRNHFDLVLNMLAGRYADSRIRELKPRIAIDRLANMVHSRKGALLAFYMGGGVIPDRGYFHLRHQDSGAQIGDLDEEFVWEARIGQTFTLGTQHWRIERITHNDVFVQQASPKSLSTPFWKGEELIRDFHFSTRIGEFLEKADDELKDTGFVQSLQNDYHLDARSAQTLKRFLTDQKTQTGCPLPHRHHILVENVKSGPGGVPGNQVILHTQWGGGVNRPYALALEAAWETRFGQQLELFSGNDTIILQLPHSIPADELLDLVKLKNLETLIRKRLEGSGYFGARFRENAGTALLVNRKKINQRLPLWMSRLQSQKLLDTVMKYPDFPILLETWRTCLQDYFDMDALRLVLSELESGIIRVSEITTEQPSPMARHMAFQQINQYMYDSETLVTGKRSNLRSDLLRELVFSPGLRPTLSLALIRQFEEKRQRLSTGYAPTEPIELVEWVKERICIPYDEWERLKQALFRDAGEPGQSILDDAGHNLAWIYPEGSKIPLLVAKESLPRLLTGFYASAVSFCKVTRFDGKTEWEPDDPEDSDSDNPDETGGLLLEEWLRFYGPRTESWIQRTLGLPMQRLSILLEDLLDAEILIRGPLTVKEKADNGSDSSKITVCDSENFETLLRMSRIAARPVFDPLPVETLSLFLAHYQGLCRPARNVEEVALRLEQLCCYPAAAASWETLFLPARATVLEPGWLDSILQETGLIWMGTAPKKVMFLSESDLDLVELPPDHKQDNWIVELLPDVNARYPMSSLLRHSESQAADLIKKLWMAVWAGQISNDTLSALRRGLESDFSSPETGESDSEKQRGRKGGRRARFGQWKQSVSYPGNWFRFPNVEPAEDVIELEEKKKDRVRILLDRYGILFRELLVRESQPFLWSALFRTLRIMELSGEILSGYFFDGIPGPQFMAHHAFRLFLRKLPDEAVYWLNATDPASLCGVQIDRLKASLPRRIESTDLVFQGEKPIMISKKKGAELTILIPPDDPGLPFCFAPLSHSLTRPLKPLRRINVESINGEYAAGSVYVDELRTVFDVILEHRHVTLYKKRD